MIARFATWGLVALYVLELIVIAALWRMGTTIVSATPAILGVAFASVGALLALRRPRNTVGWLCFTFALFATSSVAALAYATQARSAPGTLPGGSLAAWWAGWSMTPAFLSLTIFLPLLFPTGRPPSNHWRPLLWAAFASLAAMSFIAALSPGPLAGASAFENPFPLAILGEPAAVAVRGIVFAGEVAVTLAAMASLIVRYRSADSVERHQLKWFTWAFGIFFLVLMLGTTVSANGGERVLRALLWWELIWPLSAAVIPLAIGIAVMRYRLYDIDLIINRTLVYGGTTGAIAAVFFGVVFVLQALLRPLISGSELSVAASTLLTVALFQPLRRRVQNAVDRRFYRARYDAQHTFDVFGARLRDEVDLDALRAELLGVVHETVRPTHASVWLRDAQR